MAAEKSFLANVAFPRDLRRVAREVRSWCGMKEARVEMKRLVQWA
jgi:hypothetical protein